MKKRTGMAGLHELAAGSGAWAVWSVGWCRREKVKSVAPALLRLAVLVATVEETEGEQTLLMGELYCG
jgi:hypothetical protein